MESNRPYTGQHPEADADISLDIVSVERDMALIDSYIDRAEALRGLIDTSQPPDLIAHRPKFPFVHSIQSLGYIAFLGKNHVLRHYASYLEEKAERIRDIYCDAADQE